VTPPRFHAAITTPFVVQSEGSTVAAVKRRVAAQLAGYPPAPRAPFA